MAYFGASCSRSLMKLQSSFISYAVSSAGLSGVGADNLLTAHFCGCRALGVPGLVPAVLIYEAVSRAL